MRCGGYRSSTTLLYLAVAVSLTLSLSLLGTVSPSDGPVCGEVEYEGTGSSSNPYEVASLEQLQCIGGDHMGVDGAEEALDASYVLVSDVDASATEHWVEGFEPIGGHGDRFTGEFDGGGYVVEGLYVDRPESTYVGVFGYSEGDVRDAGLEDAYVSGGFNTAGVVGVNTGDVRRVYVSGEVVGDTNIGGVVGANEGGVRQVYSAGEVVGEETVGGVLGLNAGSVEEAYSVARVYGGVFAGGAVGTSDGAVEYVYWSRDESGQTRSAGSPDHMGLSSEEMHGEAALESLAGFDFTATWMTSEGYPVLRWQAGEYEVEVTSTTSPVYEGEVLEVEARVTNVDGLDGEGDVWLEVDGDEVDSIGDLGVEAGDSREVALEWQTTQGDAGGYTAVVRTSDGSASTEVTVEPDDAVTAGDDGEPADGEPQPGFGVVVAFVALLTLAVAGCRSNEG